MGGQNFTHELPGGEEASGDRNAPCQPKAPLPYRAEFSTRKRRPFPSLGKGRHPGRDTALPKKEHGGGVENRQMLKGRKGNKESVEHEKGTMKLWQTQKKKKTGERIKIEMGHD